LRLDRGNIWILGFVGEKVLGRLQIKIIMPNAFAVMAVDMWRKEDLYLRVLLECRHIRTAKKKDKGTKDKPVKTSL